MLSFVDADRGLIRSKLLQVWGSWHIQFPFGRWQACYVTTLN